MKKLTNDAYAVVYDYRDGNEKATSKFLREQPIAWRIVLMVLAALRLAISPLVYLALCTFEVFVVLNQPRGDKRKRWAQAIFYGIACHLRVTIWTNLDTLTYGSFNLIQKKATGAAKDYYYATIEIDKV